MRMLCVFSVFSVVAVWNLGASPIDVSEAATVVGGAPCTHYLVDDELGCPNTIATTGCNQIDVKQRHWWCWRTADIIPVALPNCNTFMDPNNPVPGVTCGNRTRDTANNNCTIHVLCAPF